MATPNQIMWKEAGLCHWCGAEKNDNKFCVACRERHNAYGRANMAKRRALGLSVNTGSRHKPLKKKKTERELRQEKAEKLQNRALKRAQKREAERKRLHPDCASCGNPMRPRDLEKSTTECRGCAYNREMAEELAKPRGFPWDGRSPDCVLFRDDGYHIGYYHFVRNVRTLALESVYLTPYPQSELGQCSCCGRLGNPNSFNWKLTKGIEDRFEAEYINKLINPGTLFVWPPVGLLRLTGLCITCCNRLRPMVKAVRESYELHKLQRAFKRVISDTRAGRVPASGEPT